METVYGAQERKPAATTVGKLLQTLREDPERASDNVPFPVN
jgi:hypothetical protein